MTRLPLLNRAFRTAMLSVAAGGALALGSLTANANAQVQTQMQAQTAAPQIGRAHV